MKPWILTFTLTFVAVSPEAVLSARGQSTASALRGTYSVNVGAEGSMFQPDYAGNGLAQASPQLLSGIGAFGDVRFNRWAQIEAEARWLRFNEYLGISQDTYSIGPRIPIKEDFHKFTPYAKLLIGWGSMTDLTGKAFQITYGGGVDYRLTDRFSIRAFDFEYQRWHVYPNTVSPYGGSVGLSYRIR
jgi:hypothetical protein